MVIKYPPRNAWYTHSPNCWCDRCFKSKTKGKRPKKLDYFEYIKSPLWQQRKTAYYRRHRKVCQACGSYKVIQLHHMEYGNFGQEPDYALVSLCEICHKDFHKRYGGSTRNMIKATKLYIEAKQSSIKSLLGGKKGIDGKSL